MASSHAQSGVVLTAGIAGVAAGAMAAGEYVCVSSQVDVERADLVAEARQQARDPSGELAELADIYEQRGLPRALAEQAASAFHALDRSLPTCEMSGPNAAHSGPAHSSGRRVATNRSRRDMGQYCHACHCGRRASRSWHRHLGRDEGERISIR